MTKAQTAVVTIYVVLGLLNLGLGLYNPLSAVTVINLLFGAYSLFRAKEEYEKAQVE